MRSGNRRTHRGLALGASLVALLALASCAASNPAGRCVYRFQPDDQRGSQLRWSSCADKSSHLDLLFGRPAVAPDAP